MKENNVFLAIQKLQQKNKFVGRNYFSFTDILKFSKVDKDVLKVSLARLVKQNKIFRLIKGYYCLSMTDIDYESFACEIVQPSYISFEYALWKHGLINEIPTTLTLATTKKTKKYFLSSISIEYSQIKKELFFGYIIDKNVLLAEKEKAVLDEFYMVSINQRSFNLSKIDFFKLNKKSLFQWLNKYPESTKLLVKKFIK